MVDLKQNTINSMTSQQQIDAIRKLEQIVIMLIGREKAEELKPQPALKLPEIETQTN